MPGYRSITPSINVNTASGQLRTELLNTFSRLDGQLPLAPYKLFTFNGPAGNTGAAETTLSTNTLDVGTLSKQGSSVLIFVAGVTAANGNNKTLKLYFGGTEIFTSGAFAGNNISWTLQAEVVRNGATAQLTWAQFFGSATLTSKIQVGTASVSLALPQIVKITGTATTTDDISLYYIKQYLMT